MKSSGFLICFTFSLLSIISCKNKTVFELIPGSHSGVTFNNTITETDSMTPFSHPNIYNGAGVGIGDFNNDGLQDIFFTGNMVSCRLYLNKGDFTFEDITLPAGVEGKGRWCKGVSVVDINNDGKEDIYISVAMDTDPEKRENLLYINQGNNKEGIPWFKEEAAAYGLNNQTHSIMSYFFDYDNDGDLDMYTVVNEVTAAENPSKFRTVKNDGSSPSTGRIYRNDWNENLKHGVFTDVSAQAGLTLEGYGLSANICDINQDGWKDIYVTNDFVSSNILYINNGNGTFTDRSREYFKHTSTFAMGVDVQDINNDALADIVELDMNPEDNFRKKMMLGANSYETFQNFDRYGYQYQYSRNTLQLNRGYRPGKQDSAKVPVFSEIGYLSGIAETDWSWTPLVTDFNNDGYRDIIVTNGYPRDVTDHDFMIYRAQTNKLEAPLDALKQVPQVKLHNYAFQNNGDLTFSDRSMPWGLDKLSFSGGAAYVDLDNDGDMDMVISNIDDPAMIYRNRTVELDKNKSAHYLNISFSGESKNVNGLGAIVHLYYNNDQQQIYEHTPYRGYLSTVQNIAHFGLGTVTSIDSLVVTWPDGKEQHILQVPCNQLLVLNYRDAEKRPSLSLPSAAALFSNVTAEKGIDYQHTATDFADFNIQKLLPHKFSEYAPAMAVGDVNGDGLDDFICTGSDLQPAQLFIQQRDGKFTQRNLLDSMPKSAGLSGVLLFDVDGDQDLDLYICSGGYKAEHNTAAYSDHLFLNDGKGHFKELKDALPNNFTSKSCVRAVDFDRDGDLDIFVGGRVDPWNYPKPVSSRLYRNDSHNGTIKFTDITPLVAKDLIDIGLVSDALFTDFDNDGWPDLVIAGEWMSPRFLKNDRGIFKDITKESGLSEDYGWWTCIVPGDFDNDGDIDYIVGNLGLNSFYKASDQYPVFITAKDFDGNGIYDAFPSLFLPTSQTDTQKREYPAPLKDDATKQVPALRKKFERYKTYATATMEDLFTAEQRKGALRLKANELASCYFRNDGNGKFTKFRLPNEAQFSTLYGASVNDFDGDGNLDVVMNGNDFGTDVSVGRYDALNGLFLKGDGKGNFTPLSLSQSGIYIPGNGKALVCFAQSDGSLGLAASQNKGQLLLFTLDDKKNKIWLKMAPDDQWVNVFGKNGTKQKRELYFGNGFISQSTRDLFLGARDSVVEIHKHNNSRKEKLR